MAEIRTPVKTNSVLEAEKISIPPSPFLRKLGYGSGVSVMELVRSPKAGQIRSPWALKTLNNRYSLNKLYADRLQAEAELLQRMSHPNIVGFRAFENTKILYLGMEACDISLGDMIERRIEEDPNCEPFRPKQMLKVIRDIGSALNYLHTKMQILHGDMKSYNMLVNGDFEVCKLCDFGVTVPLDENGIFDSEKSKNIMYYGTEPWNAPEVIHGGLISTKTDIWPLGLIIWEMMALMPPHSQMDDSLNEIMSSYEDEIILQEYLSKRYGARPAIPTNISETVYAGPLSLFWCCTETSPADRPTAQHLTEAATNMLSYST